MKMLSTWMLPLCLALATPALAQRRPGSLPPPGAQPVRPTPVPAPVDAAQQPSPASGRERQITPQQDAAANGTEGRGKPTCEQARRNARYSVYFDKVDIEKLIQTVSDATCRTFILPENVRGKVSIIGPENGRLEVGPDEFYAAFLASLDANGLAVYPSGRFLKIVDKRSAKQNTIPTVVDPDAEYTFNEQMITKLFKIRYSDVEPLRGVLQQLVSKDGDTIPYPPDTIIVNDVGSNIHRLEKIINQLDTRASSDEVRAVQVQYASAQDVAATIQKIFEAKSSRPGQRAGTFAPPAAGQAEGAAPAQAGTQGSSGPVTLSQIIPDERTNKLIIVASPAAFERIAQLIKEIDVPISGEGRINVYGLANANSEEIASTLQSLAQGTSNRPRVGSGPAANIPGVAAGRSGGAAELFSGEVKISADKGTNSLVIVASQSDYRNVVRVIEQLDKPRRQVFVEAVIMEVNLDRSTEFGINLHSGYALRAGENASTGVAGTSYNKGSVPPSFSLANLASFGGFLAGLQGPVIPELKALGIPSFGVILHALQTSSDVNVLSTPHLLTSDNEEAEITVGQNVPFQAGFSPSSVGSALGTAGQGAAGGLNASLLGSLGGLGSLYAPITRQNVELKLTIKPQINESDFVRLVIAEQTEEIASENATLGPTTSKRSAKTTVVAKDQETVVIGGIMQDRTIESVSKVPVLGDVPIIGHLFRQTTRRKTKTNLLLFLTPYIIRDGSDFRRIFERKMKERQQFVEQFYGQVPGYEIAVDFERKPGPLGRMHRALLTEEAKAENGGPGAPGEKVIRPVEEPAGNEPAGTPPSPGEVSPTNPAPAPPPAGEQPAPVPPGPGDREDASPPSGSSPSAPVQEPPPERIRVQPDSTGATRS
jgi:general secretion pathway protein D